MAGNINYQPCISSAGAGVLKGIFFIIILLFPAFAGQHVIKAQTAEPYRWKNVQILGGGFVTGVIYNETEKDLLYARTDVGGAYRWDPSNSVWLPITDHIGKDKSDYTGVLSIATDPSDPDRVYSATGLYTQWWAGNAAILASADRGQTWTTSSLSIKLGGNEDGRSAGERLQVDPNLGSIIYLGSSKDGLWKSTNYGVNWSKVVSFPVSETPGGAGISFVIFDKSTSSTGNPTQTIFAGILQTGNNLYRSQDGGTTWDSVPGGPAGLMPHHAAIEADSILYITYCDGPGPNGVTSGEVWKYYYNRSQWVEITPPAGQGGFAGISADPQQPGTLLVSTIDRWWPHDEIYRSTDGGSTWKALLETSLWDYSPAPYTLYSNPHWTGDVDIDPFDSDNAWFITGYGLWASNNITDTDADDPASWKFMNEGLEETVPLGLISPPSGAYLVSAIGDIDGFRHDDLNTSPVSGRFTPRYGTNTSIDYAEKQPSFMVRTHNNSGGHYGAFSTNGGTTWAAFGSAPSGTTGGGTIAVSADANTIVWCPGGASMYYSVDNGLSWQTCSGAGSGLKPVSDRQNPLKFYVYDVLNGRVLTSVNGGVSFIVTATGLPSLPDYEVSEGSTRTVFGKEGHLWLAAPDGLYRSVSSGTNFQKMPAVQKAGRIGFGRALPGTSYPAIYMSGKVNDTSGFFRSDDEGESWTRINNDKQQFGWINVVTGDPRVYGRMYIATGGRGILFGEPLYDCNGDLNGTAYYDACDSCVGGNTGKEPCVTGSKADYKTDNICYSPNPFSGELYIRSDMPFEYSISGISGLYLGSQSCSGNCHIGRDLQKGIYILTINKGDKINRIKILKH